eukprot:RCo049321
MKMVTAEQAESGEAGSTESPSSFGGPSSTGPGSEPLSPSSPPEKKRCSPDDKGSPVVEEAPTALSPLPVGPSSSPLLDYHSTAEYLREAFVYHGYRAEGMRWAAVAPSLFQLHNETWNIWTHLLGCVAVVGVLVHTLCSSTGPAAYSERLPALIFLLSLAFVLGCSAVFHWFLCVNEKVFVTLKTLDWAAIPLLISGSGFASASYLFPEAHRTARNVHLALIAALGLIVSLGPILPPLRHRFRFSAAHFSAIVLLAIACGAVPMAHLWLLRVFTPPDQPTERPTGELLSCLAWML